MAGPWERYGAPASPSNSSGPWAKYAPQPQFARGKLPRLPQLEPPGLPSRQPTDRYGYKIDLGRPIVPDPETGERQTERGISIQADIGEGERFYNIPSINNGEENPDYAISEFMHGRLKPTGSFDTLDDAEIGSRERSSDIARVRFGEDGGLGTPWQKYSAEGRTDALKAKLAASPDGIAARERLAAPPPRGWAETAITAMGKLGRGFQAQPALIETTGEMSQADALNRIAEEIASAPPEEARRLRNLAEFYGVQLPGAEAPGRAVSAGEFRQQQDATTQRALSTPSPEEAGQIASTVSEQAQQHEERARQAFEQYQQITGMNPTPEDASWIEQVIFSAAESAPYMATAIGGGLVGGPGVGVTLMGSQAMINTYGQERMNGRTPEEAAGYALFTGVTEGLTETIPLGIILKRGGSGLLSRVLKGAVAEGATEVVAESLQAGYEAGVLGDEITAEEFFHQVSVAGGAGALLGGGGAAVAHPFVRGQESETDTPPPDVPAEPGLSPPTQPVAPSPAAVEPSFVDLAREGEQGPVQEPSSTSQLRELLADERPLADIQAEAEANRPPPPPDGSRESPAPAEDPIAREAARARAEAPKSEAQAEAGNFRKGHVNYEGFDITIETARGQERTGVDRDGKPWSAVSPADYGYIKRTKGADGDQIDVYLGDSPQAPRAYVIDQINLETGLFDEHKALLGFDTKEEAIGAYVASFSDARGAERIGGITEATPQSLSQTLKSKRFNKNAPLDFDPLDQRYQRSAKTYIASNRSLEPAKIAKALKISPAQATRLFHQIASQPDARIFVSRAGNIRRKPATGRPEHVTEFLARRGGINNAEGHDLVKGRGLQKMIPGVGPLIRKTGLSIDAAGEILWEAGFFGPIATTPRPQESEVLELIERATRSNIYRAEDMEAVQAFGEREDRAREADELDAEISAYGKELGFEFSDSERQEITELMEQYGYNVEGATDAFAERKTIREADEGAEQAGDESYFDDIPFETEQTESGEPYGEDVEGQARAPAAPAQGVEDGTTPAQDRRPQEEERKPELATEPGAEGLPQTVMPGAERSARQAAQAREEEGHGRLRAKAAQQNADDGLFAEKPGLEPDLFAPPAAAPSEKTAEAKRPPAKAETPNIKTESAPPAPEKPPADRGKPIIETGIVLRTQSGRETSPAPKIDGTTDRKTKATLKRMNAWLLSEARKEAEGQDYLSTLLGAIDLNNVSQSDQDTINDVLFGDPDGATIDDIVRIEKPGKKAPATKTESAEEEGGRVRLFGGRQKSEKPFFSALTRAVESIKQNKAPPIQWKAIINNLSAKGVKKEEVEWSGVMTWLDSQSGSVTKDDLLQFLSENEVRVEEVEKGSSNQLSPGTFVAELRPSDGEWLVRDTRNNRIEGVYTDEAAAREGAERNNGYLSDDTKFASYVLPGGENYRELLLTLPIKTSPKAKEGLELHRRITAGEFNSLDDAARKAILAKRDQLLKEGRNEEGEYFEGGHFDEPNVLAHIRFDDRTTADGKKALHIAEIQSDWHQKGRRGGYSTTYTADEVVPYNRGEAINEFGVDDADRFWHFKVPGNVLQILRREHPTQDQALAYVLRKNKTYGVPNAPFKDSWQNLALKRMIRYASENGYDVITWDTGEIQADRYDLSKQIDTVDVLNHIDGGRFVDVRKDGKSVFDAKYSDDGTITDSMADFEGKNLSDVLGKDIADKILAIPKDAPTPKNSYRVTRLEGLDLKVGGEGMRGFYDKILPAFANKYGKKWGARVQSEKVVTRDSILPEGGYVAPDRMHLLSDEQRASLKPITVDVHALPITDAMRESVAQGQPLFKRGKPSTEERARIVDAIKQKMAALEKGLAPRLKKVGLSEKIALRVLARIDAGEGFTASGHYLDRLISISLESTSAEWTLNHEIIHGLRDLDVIRKGEWEALKRAALADKTRMASVRKNYGDLEGYTEEMLIEEAVADMFADWVEGGTKRGGLIGTAFNRIKNLIEAIGNALRGAGFHSVEDIFQRIDRGEVGGRPEGQEAGRHSGVQGEEKGKFALPSDFDQLIDGKAKGPRAASAVGGKGGNPRAASNFLKRSPPLPKTGDYNWLSRFLLHPYQMATKDSDFAAVFFNALKFIRRRNEAQVILGETIESYMRLSETERANINKALEIGRLDAKDYSDQKTIQVKNKIHDTAMLPMGETITLSQKERKGYLAVRKMFDQALLMFKQQVLIEAGLTNDGDPRTPDAIRDKAKDAGTPKHKRQDLERAADLIEEIEVARRSGYVPFSRYGEFGITVTDQLGGVVHFEKFERGIGSRKRVAEARKRLQEKYPRSEGFIVQKTRSLPKTDVSGIQDIDFAVLDDLAKRGGASEDTINAYNDAVRGGWTKQGFRSHFIESKNTPGYETDFTRSISDYIIGLSGYLARRSTMDAFDESITAIPNTKPMIRQYAKDYRTYLLNPVEEWGSWRGLMFYGYLAGNPSSAALNLTQVPLFTAPFMTMVANEGRVAKQLTNASAVTARMFSPQAKADALNFDLSKAPPDLRGDLQELLRTGELVPMVTLENMGVAQGRKKFLRGMSQGGRAVMEAAGTMFTAAERFNRISTAVAALRLARDPKVLEKADQVFSESNVWKNLVGAKTKPEPIDLARFVIYETHFLQGKVNRPKAMRGIGASLLQFQSFMWNALQVQWRMAKFFDGGAQAKAAGQKGIRRAGKKALALVALSHFLAAGLFALPGADDAKEWLEYLHSMFRSFDLDIEKEIQEAMVDAFGPEWGPTIGEIIRRGALRQTGVDMSARIGMGQVLPVSPPAPTYSAQGQLEKMVEPFGIPGSVFSTGMRALDNIIEGDWGTGLSDMSRFVISAGGANVARSIAMSEEGLRTRSGALILHPDDLEASDVYFRAFGFQSTRIARRYETDWMQTRIEFAVRELQSHFNRRMARAIAAEDDAGQSEIEADIESWNEGKPEYMQVRITQQGLRYHLETEQSGRREARQGRAPVRSRAERERVEEIMPAN